MPRAGKVAGTVAAGAAAGGISQLTGSLSDELISAVTDRFVASAPPTPTIPGVDWLLKANSAGLGVTAGVVGGAGLAVGALWGGEKISLENKPLWKRLLFSPAVSLYNDGISFRGGIGQARTLPTPEGRFGEGFKAGFKVGAKVGGGAGRIQGAFSGGVLGWEMSGRALEAVQQFTQPAELPPLLNAVLPLAVTASCVVAGQTVGAAIGSLVGQAAGGTIVGVSSGLYSATSPVAVSRTGGHPESDI